MKENWKFAGMLLLSFVLPAFLPQGLNILTYMILGVSAFLFMVGYFRLSETLDAFSDAVGHTTAHVIGVVAGLFLISIGPVYVRVSGASGKSMLIAVFYMFEGILILNTAERGILNLKSDRTISVAVRFFAVCMIAAGLLSVFSGDIMSAFFALMDSVVLWISASVSAFREKVENMTIPIADLVQRCKNVDSPLGAPRLEPVGKQKECIVFGPDDSGLFVYGYYKGKSFFVALGETEQKERSMEDTELLDQYQELFENLAN